MDPNDKAFNSFTSGPGGIYGGTMPVPSAGASPSPQDDIILHNGVSTDGKAAKFKKPLLILGIAAAVLLIIGGIFLLIGKNRGDSAFTADARTSANQFANFVFYGEADSADFKAPTDANEKAYFFTAISEADSDTRTAYLQNLRKYYNEMLSEYKKARPDNATMAIYQQKMNLFLNFSEYELPASTEVATIYAESGENAARQVIKSAVEHYKNAGEFYGLNYYDLATTWQDKTLEKFKNFNDNGCFSGGVVDYLCAARNSNQKLDTEISNAEIYLESVREQVKADLVMGAAEIVAAVKENTESENTKNGESAKNSEKAQNGRNAKSAKNNENIAVKLNHTLAKIAKAGEKS